MDTINCSEVNRLRPRFLAIIIGLILECRFMVFENDNHDAVAQEIKRVRRIADKLNAKLDRAGGVSGQEVSVEERSKREREPSRSRKGC